MHGIHHQTNNMKRIYMADDGKILKQEESEEKLLKPVLEAHVLTLYN